jgi:hypothetical protein
MGPRAQRALVRGVVSSPVPRSNDVSTKTYTSSSSAAQLALIAELKDCQKANSLILLFNSGHCR